MSIKAFSISETYKHSVQQQILQSVAVLVAEGGFRNAGIAKVAEHANIATGTIYRYFKSRGALLSEFFRIAAQQEIDQIKAAFEREGTASERLEHALRVFASRALRSPNTAWALLAEPVDLQVDTERLIYRRTYASLFKQVLREGIQTGEFFDQDTTLSSAVIVGIISETLAGPLSPFNQDLSAECNNHDPLITAIVNFCLNAVKYPQREKL